MRRIVPTARRVAVAEARLASSAGELPESLRVSMFFGGEVLEVPTEAYTTQCQLRASSSSNSASSGTPCSPKTSSRTDMASLKTSGMLLAVCWFHGFVLSQPSTASLGGGSVDMNSVPPLAAAELKPKPWTTLVRRGIPAPVKGPSIGAIFATVVGVFEVVDSDGMVG